MSILIRGMEMPTSCGECAIKSWDGEDDVCPFSGISALSIGRQDDCPLVPVSPHGDLIKRIVYRGEVYNAIEAARINALDGILSDRYKDGFHDGLKRALQILANVEDAPVIILTEEGE